ncbi:MAG: Hsp33 family molecular chaperone HslO [Clostridia bacterium]
MDIFKKFMLADKTVMVSVISAKDMVDKAIKLHGLSRTASAALGRTLIVGAFMAEQLKSETQRLTITVNGGGGLGRLVVCGEYGCKVRGYVENPNYELPLNANGKLDVGGAVGKNGYISVIKDMGMKEPYLGRSSLVDGEIANDFTYYFTVSEQQPSAVALGVLVGDEGCVASGGIIVQIMPNCNDYVITMMEDIVSNFSNISSLMSDFTVDEIIEKYFGHLDIFELPSQVPKYECNCNRDRIEKILLSLGKSEAYDILATEGKVELCCQFCNTKYVFDEKALKALF